MSGRSGYGRSKIVGKLIHLPANMMMAGLAPRVGKPGWAIRLYWKRVDDCCIDSCPPITIVKRIVWYPYNNSVDNQGNPVPQNSNYVAIQFNRPISVFPDPAITNPPIRGNGSAFQYNNGGVINNTPPANAFQPGKVVLHNTAFFPLDNWRLGFAPVQGSGAGTVPNPAAGEYFQETAGQPLSDPLVYKVFLMDDLQEYSTTGVLQVKHPGQWLVMEIAKQDSNGGVGGLNRIIYPKYPDNGGGFGNADGGIQNYAGISLLHKLQYTLPAVPTAAGVTAAPITRQIRTIDCETNSLTLISSFNDSYLDNAFVKE